MQITVAICTRDRSASLARTLASLEHVTPPDCSWELLVIDNACSDDTRDVIAGFAGRLPIRTETEPRPGLSHARNRAMASARGRYLVGTDDDVLVDAGWLRAYRAAFARWPEAALFAGRIVPVLQEPVTDWFARHKAKLGYPLAARDMGDRPIALSLEADRHPFGANYAVRTEIQRLFPFDGELGAGTSHFGEEVTVFKAMLAAGHSGRWLPDCRVEHLIGPERQTRSYVQSWFRTLGRTTARTGEDLLTGPRIVGVPRWLWRRAALRTLAYHRSRLSGRSDVWLDRLIEMSVDRGRIDHLLSARRARARR